MAGLDHILGSFIGATGNSGAGSVFEAIHHTGLHGVIHLAVAHGDRCKTHSSIHIQVHLSRHRTQLNGRSVSQGIKRLIQEEISGSVIKEAHSAHGGFLIDLI